MLFVAVCVLQYAVVSPKMSGLLVKLQFINTTILELPAAMQSAYANLNSAKANMVGSSPALRGTQLARLGCNQQYC